MVQVNVEHKPGAGGHRYGNTWLPANFTVSLSPIVRADLNVGVRLTIHADEQGPVCREVAFYSTTDDGTVPAAVLRGFSLEDWISRACQHAALTIEDQSDDVTAWTLPEPGEGSAVRADVRRARKTARGTGYTREFLTEVAQVYRQGGRTPTKAVREAFGVAQSTAQMYVSKARAAGLLEPATKDRGES